MMSRKKKQRAALFWLILALIILVIILLLRSCGSAAPAPGSYTDSPAAEKSLDFTPAADGEPTIQLPVMSGLYMRADQLEQVVDFYNPAENNCYFIVSLYLSDDTLIYQSERVLPGEHITDISLLQALQRGVYRNCWLVYDCYSLLDDTALNGGRIAIEINVG